MVTINIQKKDLFLIVAVVVFIAASFYVIAYNSGASPSVMGHSLEEIGIPSTCSNGQVLKWVSSSNRWVCGDYLSSDKLCYCIQCRSECCGGGDGPERCGKIDGGYTGYSFWPHDDWAGESGGCRIKLYICPW
jgi:hypothetical protein